MLFCVEQNYPSKLPYGCIAYKGTSLLHELLLYDMLTGTVSMRLTHHVLSATSICNTRLQNLLDLTSSADIQLHVSELDGCDSSIPLNSYEILCLFQILSLLFARVLVDLHDRVRSRERE